MVPPPRVDRSSTTPIRVVQEEGRKSREYRDYPHRIRSEQDHPLKSTGQRSVRKRQSRSMLFPSAAAAVTSRSDTPSHLHRRSARNRDPHLPLESADCQVERVERTKGLTLGNTTTSPVPRRDLSAGQWVRNPDWHSPSRLALHSARYPTLTILPTRHSHRCQQTRQT